ncbi:MAG: hypothetical protein LBJ46_02245 [Planctomycetota bacterium]|jgi:hypothetical protein|nr:hypothetical protein [Planctomycetota bacterium]
MRPLAVAALFCCSVFPAAGALCAGDAAPGPAEKPFAVMKADDPARFFELIDLLEPAFPALGRLDRQLRLPGFVAVPDPRALFGALSSAGATELWIGLGASGGTAMGWREPSSGEGDQTAEVRARLERVGIDMSRAALRTWRDGERIAVAVGAVDDFYPGNARERGRDREWRGSLDQFLASGGDGAGLWLNARPLSGLLALAAGFDMRGFLRSAGLTLPEAVRLTVFPSEGGVGARLRLDGMADPGFRAASDGGVLSGVNFGRDAFLVFSVGGLDVLAGGDSPHPLGRLLPKSAAVALRRRVDGGIDWTLAAAVDGASAAASRRLAGLIELVSADPRTGVDSARRQIGLIDGLDASMGSSSFTLAVKDAVGGGSFVLASSDGTMPDLARAQSAPLAGADLAAAWDANLEAVPWSRLERPVMDMLGRFPGDVDPAGLLSLMPTRESGWFRLENGSAEAYLPRLALLWLLPYVVEQARDFVDSFRPTATDLAAARLRFMLDVAMQSRFRAVSAESPGPLPLPEKPDWLDFSDPVLQAWLADSFGEFPGAKGANWSGLRVAFSGRILDGYEFGIVPGSGWALRAQPAPGGEDLPALEIDSRGFLRAYTVSGQTSPWREEPLVTALLLAR